MTDPDILHSSCSKSDSSVWIFVSKIFTPLESSRGSKSLKVGVEIL